MPNTSPPLQEAISALANRLSLSERLAAQVFEVVMRGEATPAQVAALLIGLRVKGETAEEVAGAARALRDAMIRVEADLTYLVDTCGTGGGTVTTFNISTAAAFVAGWLALPEELCSRARSAARFSIRRSTFSPCFSL